MAFDPKKPNYQQKPRGFDSSFGSRGRSNKPLSSSERDVRNEEEWMKRNIEQRKLKAKKASGPATYRLGDQLREALSRVKKS